MSQQGAFEIEFMDYGRFPQCPPDPAHPRGMDVDCSYGRTPNCQVMLPYPAKGCGSFLIRCLTCNTTIVITTAGRVDDPRSVRVACKRN